jgi:hypothetical protein
MSTVRADSIADHSEESFRLSRRRSGGTLPARQISQVDLISGIPFGHGADGFAMLPGVEHDSDIVANGICAAQRRTCHVQIGSW